MPSLCSFHDKHVIENVMQRTDFTHVSLVGINYTPENPKNFFQKVLAVSTWFQEGIKVQWNNGANFLYVD